MTSCLIVDDNANNRLVARYILEDLHCDVVEAASAEAASAILATRSFDVMLLDWMMPQMDGIDFLARLRRQPETAKLNVVMCSAKDGETHFAAARDAGATAYLAKPITFDDAAQMLKQLGLR